MHNRDKRFVLFVSGRWQAPAAHIFPPPIAFFVLQKGIEGGFEDIVVCGVVCIGV